MNPNPLAQLNDISTPTGVALWPLAWGWWVLIATLFAVAIVSIWAVTRHIKRNKIRNAGRKQIALLRQQESSSLADINAVLKQVAMGYSNNQAIASLHGKQWQTFLINSLKKGKGTSDFANQLETFSTNLYAPVQQEVDGLQLASYWLDNLSLPALQHAEIAMLTQVTMPASEGEPKHV